jgi:hypothetical protein
VIDLALIAVAACGAVYLWVAAEAAWERHKANEDYWRPLHEQERLQRALRGPRSLP